MNNAKNILKKVKKNIAKDAFITRVASDLLTAAKKTKEKKTLKVVATPPPVIHEVKRVVKPQSAVVATPVVQEVVAQNPLKKKDITTTSVQEQQTLQETKQLQKEIVVAEEKDSEDAKTEDTKRNTAINKKTLNKDYFIGISGGAGNINIKEAGDLALDIDLKDSVISYGIEGGYNISDNFFITLNYQYTSGKDFYLHNAYTTLDYRFTRVFGLSPYTGIIGGFSTMNWINYPISSINSIGTTYSFLGGAQLGADIDISDSFAFSCSSSSGLSMTLFM
jgi:TusA-related sulfurtransferase